MCGWCTLLAMTGTILVGCGANSSDPAARASAMSGITDQPTLVKYAQTDPDPGVRAAATANVTDQSVLSMIAINDKSPDVCIAAVNNLTDQSLLERIASANRAYTDIRVTWAASVRLDALRKAATQPTPGK